MQNFEALKVAEKVAKPELIDLITDVYDAPIPALTKQFNELEAHIKKHPEAPKVPKVPEWYQKPSKRAKKWPSGFLPDYRFWS